MQLTKEQKNDSVTVNLTCWAKPNQQGCDQVIKAAIYINGGDNMIELEIDTIKQCVFRDTQHFIYISAAQFC